MILLFRAHSSCHCRVTRTRAGRTVALTQSPHGQDTKTAMIKMLSLRCYNGNLLLYLWHQCGHVHPLYILPQKMISQAVIMIYSMASVTFNLASCRMELFTLSLTLSQVCTSSQTHHRQALTSSLWVKKWVCWGLLTCMLSRCVCCFRDACMGLVRHDRCDHLVGGPEWTCCFLQLIAKT